MGGDVRRYIDILIIIFTFSYSICMVIFWQQHPYFFVHFLNVFSFFIYLYVYVVNLESLNFCTNNTRYLIVPLIPEKI